MVYMQGEEPPYTRHNHWLSWNTSTHQVNFTSVSDRVLQGAGLGIPTELDHPFRAAA